MAEEQEPSFPAGDAAAELHLETDKSVKVDPISENIATSLELKEQLEAAEREREDRKNNEATQTLKKTVVVSGILAVAISVIFTVVKTLKEKR